MYFKKKDNQRTLRSEKKRIYLIVDDSIKLKIIKIIWCEMPFQILR
jgi:hypothetical protein